jgi:hypothetical protein
MTRVLIAGALAFGSGCAPQTDWIERTLVTVDVTGTWYGTWTSGWGLLFELEQQGSTVKGVMRFTTGTSQMGQQGAQSGPIEGTVAGDMFRFRQATGNLEGEMTVSGDEMNGRASLGSSRPFSLRRVDPSSRPGSPGQ